jgi:GTP-binding protein
MKIASVEFVTSATRPSHYPEGALPEMAFAGRSNVGKSSLINILVQRKGLARTSNTPGRTQLINFFTVNGKVSLVDLPGYGFAKVPPAVKKKWGPMVEAYLKERDALRLVVLILDIRREPSEDDRTLLRWLELYRIPALCVLTKTDKLSRSQVLIRRRRIGESLGMGASSAEALLLFSAKTGDGREAIWKAIEEYL